MEKEQGKKKAPRAQKQGQQPGKEYKMNPRPDFEGDNPQKRKLEHKIALITGGDSGIGRAVAMAFVKEGASVCIAYLSEEKDAKETKEILEKAGGQCLFIKGDISSEKHCNGIIRQTLKHFGHLDIVVNNAAVQFPQKSLLDMIKNNCSGHSKLIFSLIFI